MKTQISLALSMLLLIQLSCSSSHAKSISREDAGTRASSSRPKSDFEIGPRCNTSGPGYKIEVQNVQKLYADGKRFLDDQDYDKAFEFFTMCTIVNYQFPKCYEGLSLVLKQYNEIELAGVCFEKYLDLRASRPDLSQEPGDYYSPAEQKALFGREIK